MHEFHNVGKADAAIRLTALIRDDAVYALWDIDTTRPRGQKWGGHHGDRRMHFE
ncbi:MAG: hypothetical protein WDA16_15120 [Candidatus Thermoplasmatota archaeon]